MSDSGSDTCDQWLTDSFRAFREQAGLRPSPTFSAENTAFTRLYSAICRGDLNAAEHICQEYAQTERVSLARVIDLVLPTVYQIEWEWQSDARSYADTVYAFWNLQRLIERLEVLSRNHPSHREPALARGRILFANAPHCRHHFGVLVASDFFRANGWDVQSLLDIDRAGLLQTLHNHAFDFLGLSIGHDGGLEGLVDLVRAARLSSCNPNLRILIGGNIFSLPRSQYDWVGADYVAISAIDAMAYCAPLVHPTSH